MDVIMKKFLKLNKRVVMKKTMFFMILALALSVKATAGNEWQVNRIVHDGKNVYVGTENVGLIAIDKQSGGQTQYSHEWDNYYKGITDLSLHEGKLYFVNRNYKLGTLREGDVTYESINVSNILPGRTYPRLAWAPDGILWTNQLTELVMYMGKITFVGYEDPEPEGGPHFVSEEQFRSLAIDSQGLVWIGCTSNNSSWHNLICYSKDDGLSFPKRNEKSLLGAILEIKIDANDSKWLAAYYGVGCYDKSGKAILYELKGVKNDLCILSDGSILVPNDKSLHILKDGVFSLICENASQKTIRCLDADGDTYYFGTEDGLFKYEAGQVMQIPLPGQTLAVEKLLAKKESAVSSASYTLDGKRLSGERPAGEKGVIVQEGRKTVVRQSSR